MIQIFFYYYYLDKTKYFLVTVKKFFSDRNFLRKYNIKMLLLDL